MSFLASIRGLPGAHDPDHDKSPAPHAPQTGPSGLGLLILLEAPGTLLGEPPPATAVAAFDNYILALEARLSRQHRDPVGFLVQWPAAESPRLLRGEPVLERLSPPPAGAPDDALLHHWRATAFVPGALTPPASSGSCATSAATPRVFAPEVTEARLLSPTPGTDRVQVAMRVRQHHVVTVVLDTAYDTEFGRLDPTRGYSLSRSVRIAEVAAPGTSAEHTLGAGGRPRLSLAAEHLLDVGRTRPKPLPADRIRLAHPCNPRRPGLGGAPVCRKHPA